MLRRDKNRAEILAYCERIAQELRAVRYDDQPLQVELDTRDASGGEKVWSWIKKGVPIRLEIGQREFDNDALFVGRRDQPQSERFSQTRAEFVQTVTKQLDEIQAALLERARTLRAQNTRRIDSKDDFYDFFTPQNRDKPEIHAGFALSHWNGQPATEETIKNDLNVTIRCIPLDAPEEAGRGVGEPRQERISRHHEPRDPHAPERRARNGRVAPDHGPQ
jgi:prolyl-tRNA synthetase